MRYIRCLFLDVLMVMTTVVMGLAAFWIRLFCPHKALGYAKCWCRVMLFYFKKIGGMKIAIEGYENLDLNGPMIIASEHQSGFDTLIWMLLLPRPCYVMKEELTRIPLLGPMLILAGMMPIKRAAGAKGLKHLLTEADKAFKKGQQVIIFPQGTRVRPGQTIRLKSGVVAMAQHANLPVYPVATNSGYFWNKNTLYPGKAARDPGTVCVAIGKPIKVEDKKLLLGDIEASWHELEEKYQLIDGEKSSLLQAEDER